MQLGQFCCAGIFAILKQSHTSMTSVSSVNDIVYDDIAKYGTKCKQMNEWIT